MRNAVRKSLALVAVVLTAGCGLAGIADDEDAVQVLEIETVTLEMKPRVNDDWPTRVSLVRVNDVGLMEDLLHMETRAWFGKGGEGFRSANPEAFYDDWEVVPGSRIGPFDVWVEEDVVGVMFCDTRESPPPVRVARSGDIRIEINREGCAVTQMRDEPATQGAGRGSDGRFGWWRF